MAAVCQCSASGLSLTDLASVFLAAAALVVSFASLYLTSLRRPDIDVEHVEMANELWMSGYQGDMPYGVRVALYFFLANTGSTGTVLEEFGLTEFREHNDGLPLLGPWTGPQSVTIGVPSAIERGQGISASVSRPVELSHDAPIPDAAEAARRLRTMRSVTATLRWRYRQPKLLQPSRRESKTRTLTVSIDAQEFRDGVLAFWRSNAFYHPLVDIVEGRAE
jgi:hypothetical protein